jgi:hypothetical protein
MKYKTNFNNLKFYVFETEELFLKKIIKHKSKRRDADSIKGLFCLQQ